MITSEVPCQAKVGSQKDEQVFKQGSIFFYGDQVVTSESESKVELFSPFPEPPVFDPDGALHSHQIVLEARQNLSNAGQKYQDNIDTTTGE